MGTDDRVAYVCVFAKPARPGVAKTRLASAVGAVGAATLARAFFEDTWSMVTSLAWAHPIAALTEEEPKLGAAHGRREVWLQGEGDLGTRIERVMQRALRGSSVAIAIGADAPGLPAALIAAARDALRDVDAVLGPAEDGGFYLLALRRCPERLLHDLPWSQEDTFLRTQERLRAFGLSCAVLQTWFDVDRPADLARLHELLSQGRIVAPQTKLALATVLAGRSR